MHHSLIERGLSSEGAVEGADGTERNRSALKRAAE